MRCFRFCGRDCRALLYPGPSRPRRAGGGKAAKRWPAGCRPLRREHTDVLPAKPSESLRSLPGRDARQTAAARVSFSLVTFFWTSKRKSPADRDVRRTTHGREAVIAKTPERHASLALTLPSPASGRGEKGIPPSPTMTPETKNPACFRRPGTSQHPCPVAPVGDGSIRSGTRR